MRCPICTGPLARRHMLWMLLDRIVGNLLVGAVILAALGLAGVVPWGGP